MKGTSPQRPVVRAPRVGTGMSSSLLLALCLLGLSLAAQASPPPHAGGPPVHAGPPAHAGPPGQAGTQRGGVPRDHFHISQRERMFIQNWYQRNLPPGLAKQGKVPPGHAKRLAKGSPWPPAGIDYQPLPRELARQLQPLPDRYGYYRVGADVVIADLAGRVVADIVYDLLQ